MNTVELLSRQAAARPHQPAIIEAAGRGRDVAISFAELDRMSRGAATTLRAAGVRPGDAVLVLVRFSAALYGVVLGVLRMGGVVMLLDPSAGLGHVRRCCRIRPPDALIAEPKAHLLRLLSPEVRSIPHKFSVGAWMPGTKWWNPSRVTSTSERIHSCDRDTPALLTFTSGSTGEPKAAVRTHGFLAAQHRALVQNFDLVPGETDLATLPVFVLANLASGVTSLLPDADLRRPGGINAGPVIRQILRHSPTTTAASPALLERLADECVRRQIMLPSFRSVFTGGAPVFPRVMEKLRRAFPEADIVAVYGSTEAEPIAKIALHETTPEDAAAILGGAGLLAGKPVDGIDLRIHPDRWNHQVGPYTAEEFEALCLPAGQAGEIVVTGEHVLKGYLHGQGDAETKFRVDESIWHRTGDAGYLDGRGRLWLLGRCAARIHDEYGTIYPLAVEPAAHNHPAVTRAALVVGDSDRRSGGRGSRRAVVRKPYGGESGSQRLPYKRDGTAGASPSQDARLANGRRVLIVQPRDGLTSSGKSRLADELKASMAWAHIDSVRLVRRIPVDSRHNAKIDYPALLRMIDRLPAGNRDARRLP